MGERDAKEIMMLNGLTEEDNRLVTDKDAGTLLRNVLRAIFSFPIPCFVIQIVSTVVKPRRSLRRPVGNAPSSLGLSFRSRRCPSRTTGETVISENVVSMCKLRPTRYPDGSAVVIWHNHRRKRSRPIRRRLRCWVRYTLVL
jgi:hypothetical protein